MDQSLPECVRTYMPFWEIIRLEVHLGSDKDAPEDLLRNLGGISSRSYQLHTLDSRAGFR